MSGFVKKRWKTARLWWQRRTRGWSDEDTWSLDMTIAQFILPRLKRFKEIENGHPAAMTEAEWDDILDQMIYSFEKYTKKWDEEPDQEMWKKIDVGFDLFAKWFYDLWW